jgi:hypothetical protein
VSIPETAAAREEDRKRRVLKIKPPRHEDHQDARRNARKEKSEKPSDEVCPS